MGYCSKCGKELLENEKFCTSCGDKVGVESANAEINNTNVSEEIHNLVNIKPQNKFKAMTGNKKPIIAIIAIVIVVIAVLLIGGNKGPNFKKIYKEYCSFEWATVGDDNSYLNIDTNPDDEDDSGVAEIDAYYAVEKVNKALDLPDSLFSEMGSTTGNDGKQTETFEEQGIVVAWKYHPDKGLEVTYKKAK